MIFIEVMEFIGVFGVIFWDLGFEGSRYGGKSSWEWDMYWDIDFFEFIG